MLRTAVALAGLSAIALAQVVIPSGGPACFTLCINAKINEAPVLAPQCASGNIACYCSSATFTSAFTQCLTDNCGGNAADIQAGQTLGAQICSSAGSGSSSAAGGASASATSAASRASGSAASGSATSSASGAASSGSSAASAYVNGLTAALTGAGLTTLAGAIPALAAVPGVPAALTTGNHTVFGPTDAAFSAAGAGSLSQTQLVNILSYHVLNGTVNASSVATSPNVTLVRTFLSASPQVLLPGGRGQVVKVSKTANGTLMVNNVTVAGNASYQNLQVQVIPSVLSIPGNLSSIITSTANLSSLAGALNAVSPTLANTLSNTRGLTVFAPVNSAFAPLASTISTLNTTVIGNVLLNHILNGTVAYSTTLAATQTVVSGSGQQLTIASNATGIFVTSGNITAKVIQGDIITANGVVHLIDQVLVNTASDTNAASAAASSAAAAATGTAANNGVVNGGSSPGGGSGSGGSGGGSTSGAFKVVAAVGAVGLSMLAGVALIL